MKKVLIIAGGLQFGGAERFAANIIEYAPEGEFSFDYLIYEGIGDDYAPCIKAKGGRVITFPSPSAGYGAYVRRLGKLIEDNHYDVVHSQTQFNSGLNMWTAAKHGVPIRISHSHTTAHEHRISKKQQTYETLMRRLIRRFSTHCCACGVQAGEWMYGKHPFTVIRNGIDTSSFAYSEGNRAMLREKHSIPADAFVIGHSGTLSPLKNQEFLIRLLPELRREQPKAMLMLLGTGKKEMKQRLLSVAEECGVSDYVVFTGAVMNVNEYLSAFDVFAFPSLREGTPLSLLEAQANGLPCIISDAVPPDACVSDAVVRCGLHPDSWIRQILSAERSDPLCAMASVESAGFDIRSANEKLYRLYRSNPKASVALSFDDGRKDNYHAAKDILYPRGLPATFNITTGYVDGSCPDDLKPSRCAPMSIEDVLDLFSYGLFEPALHGNNHLNTIEDIAEGRKKLLAWLGKDDSCRLGFASPGSGLEIAEDLFHAEPFRSGVTYVRTSLKLTRFRLLRTLSRKAARVLHSPLLYKIAYADTLLEPGNGRVIYSVPVMGDITVRQITGLVDLCIRRQKALVLMFHSIEENPADTWSWAENKFVCLCDYLNNKQADGVLEVLTVQSLFERIG